MSASSFFRLTKSRFLRYVLALFACAFAGCDPEDFIQWAADGEHALLFSSDGTRLIDHDGKIVADAPDAVAWMPDSQRIIAIRKVKAKNWDEIVGLIGQSRALAVVSAARDLTETLRQYQGDWSKFTDSEAMKLWDESHQHLSAAYASGSGANNAWVLPVYYLQQNQPDSLTAIKAALQSESDSKIDEELTPSISELVVRSALPNATVGEHILLRTVDPVSWEEAAPAGDLLAFVIDEPVRPALYVLSTQGGERVSVDSGAVGAAWSRDGQSLIYAKTTLSFLALQSEMTLGTITRRRIADDQGRLLGKIGDAEDLAGILFAKGPNRVACLSDGRILFASTSLRLPATAQEPASGMRLFTLTPGESAKVEPLLPESVAGQLPERVDLFILSPDGKSVAVPGNNGEVSIVSLETGAVSPIQDKVGDFRNKDKLLNSPIAPLPSWRTPSEICYVVPAGHSLASPRRAEVVLHQLGGTTRAISKAWTDDVADRFLPRPK